MNVPAIIAVMRAAGASDTEILNVIEAGMNGKVRSPGAERQARYRERKANGVTSDVTVTRNSDVTVPPEVQDKERSPTPPKENSTPNPPSNLSVQRKRSTPSEFFDRFWNAYPKREGSNPKQPALKAFNRAIDAGGEPETIIRGAQHYRAQQVGKDARFVAQAVTWLNQERWNDHIPTAPVLVSTGPPPDAVTDEDVRRMARELGIIK